MKLKLCTLLLSVTLLAGCVKQVNVPVPGSANQFDSDTYLSLVTTDTVIQSTKIDLASGAFPANIAGNVKTAVNELVRVYNIADTAYQAYHIAALAGTATPVQQGTVLNDMGDVQAATAVLTNAKAGK